MDIKSVMLIDKLDVEVDYHLSTVYYYQDNHPKELTEVLNMLYGTAASAIPWLLQ